MLTLVTMVSPFMSLQSDLPHCLVFQKLTSVVFCSSYSIFLFVVEAAPKG